MEADVDSFKIAQSLVAILTRQTWVVYREGASQVHVPTATPKLLLGDRLLHSFFGDWTSGIALLSECPTCFGKANCVRIAHCNSSQCHQSQSFAMDKYVKHIPLVLSIKFYVKAARRVLYWKCPVFKVLLCNRIFSQK